MSSNMTKQVQIKTRRRIISCSNVLIYNSDIVITFHGLRNWNASANLVKQRRFPIQQSQFGRFIFLPNSQASFYVYEFVISHPISYGNIGIMGRYGQRSQRGQYPDRKHQRFRMKSIFIMEILCSVQFALSRDQLVRLPIQQLKQKLIYDHFLIFSYTSFIMHLLV